MGTYIESVGHTSASLPYPHPLKVVCVQSSVSSYLIYWDQYTYRLHTEAEQMETAIQVAVCADSTVSEKVPKVDSSARIIKGPALIRPM